MPAAASEIRFRPFLMFTLSLRSIGLKTLALFMVLLGCVIPVIGATANDITALRFGAVTYEGSPADRVVIETSKPALARLLLLENPYRLVVDIEAAGWDVRSLPPQQKLSQGLVSHYRFGHPEAGIGRLVFETNQPTLPVRIFSLPPSSGGYRVVVDFIAVSQARFQQAQSAVNSTGFAVFPQAENSALSSQLEASPSTPSLNVTQSRQSVVSVPVPEQRPDRWIVAIDAGHGGKDPGALGKSGTQEKKITLAAAKSLAHSLRKTGTISPILIRDDDTYYKLRERIARAHDAGADIFISLHADSARNSKARGISVFTLSDKASDKEAEYIARNENLSDLVGGPDLSEEDPEAADELLRMFQRQTMNESSRLAAAIVRHIRDMPGGDRRGHRFAGFAVLKSPDIPSVLVEMGFLSNRQDEKNLNQKSYRDKLISRLTKAILSYLAETS